MLKPYRRANSDCDNPEFARMCDPIKDPQGGTHGWLHHFVLISIVGAGLTLPVDVEPYGPGDSEYAAAQRLLRRAVEHLGPRFADYVVGDGEYLAWIRTLTCVICSRPSGAPTVIEAAHTNVLGSQGNGAEDFGLLSDTPLLRAPPGGARFLSPAW